MRKTFLEKCINLRLCRVALVLFFLVPAISSLQANPSQNKTISGVVTSATDSEPLIGVSVQVRETATGGITDIDGRYSVSAQQGQTLVFSYIGYQSQEIKVGTSSVINVVLKEDTEMLDEVVVVGYGVQKKKLVTGATVQVKGDEIAKMNTTNPLQAMQGQTPGVSIASTSGQPGADMKVSIRGLGTVGNSAPLYLIDGVGGDISTLNPADIESIDVLKDAASAAIYGSAGANGVVLITTKQGREGKAQISFDAYYGIQNVARKANMLNAKEYMAIMDEQALNSGLSAYDWSQYQSIYDANGNVYDTDWVDTMFKDNATTESYTLGVTGGSATSTYALSLGYMSQEGIVGGSDVSNYSRYNFRVNSEHKLFKDILKVGEQVSFVYKMNNGISVGNQYNNTLRGAFGTSPIAPVYSDNNLYDSPYNDTSTSDWNKGDGNPYGLMMTDSNNENKTATFSGNVYAELQPVKNLKIKSVFGVVYGSSEYRSFKPLYKFSQYIYNEERTTVSQNANHSLGMTWTNTASYDWTMGEHSFNALLGMEAYRYEGTYIEAKNGMLKEGFDDWEHAFVGNGTASDSTNGLGASGNPHTESRKVSYFGRLGWNWKETYMVNATLRADGSSNFAKGNRFGYFPSVSAGWIITKESFFPENQVTDFIKIRGSYGITGNDPAGFYDAYRALTTNVDYRGGSGITSYNGSGTIAYDFGSAVTSRELGWEESKQMNFGLDAHFLNKRIILTGDYYIRDSESMIFNYALPVTTGYTEAKNNLVSVRNSGVELQLSLDLLPHNWDWSWTIDANIAMNKNQIKKLPNGNRSIVTGSPWMEWILTVGRPLYEITGWRSNGIYATDDDVPVDPLTGNRMTFFGTTMQAGDIAVVDQNGDYNIDYNDKVSLGNPDPKYYGGINTTVRWKGISLGVFCNYVIKRTFWNGFLSDRMNGGVYSAGGWGNVSGPALDFGGLKYYTTPGQQADLPTLIATNHMDNRHIAHEIYTDNGSFFRVKNISMSYEFPTALVNKIKLQRLRVYGYMDNVWVFSKSKTYPDPENINTNGYANGSEYPLPHKFTLGAEITF